MKFDEIQQLIKLVSRSGVTEVDLETKDFKINIKSPSRKRGQEPETIIQQVPMGSMPMQQMPMQQQQPVQQPSSQQPEPAQEALKKEGSPAEDESNYITIKSPMIGTFYRSSSPDKPPFVNVGDSIKPGEVICIIEAMKLFNEIESEVSGKVVKVLVDDAQPVEYDQPLLMIEPA